MGAGRRVIKQARVNRGLTGTHSLARYSKPGHPCQWGLKKGLRRGRRRLDKLIIVEELEAAR